MALILSRIGGFSFRHRVAVVLAWAAVVVLFVVGALTLGGSTSDDFVVPGTEAQEAGDLATERFDSLPVNAASAQVVFRAPEGEQVTDPDNAAVISASVGESLPALEQESPTAAGPVTDERSDAVAVG